MSRNLKHGDTPFISSPPLPPPDSRSSTPTQIGDDSRNLDETQAVVGKLYYWKRVVWALLLSDESMQRLKYCLHCLLKVLFFLVCHSFYRRSHSLSTKFHCWSSTPPFRWCWIYTTTSDFRRTYEKIDRCKRRYRAYHPTGSWYCEQICWRGLTRTCEDPC